ncbi:MULTISPECIES: copper chaperone PCu(A)C [unclassified Leucobacter]|uniref:copper chaperone PCu(A)C n=1 Tax=unclassified Leucobacter TaxID=2621730 RepID=UPI000620F7D3|nr:copper chaperone PCu(A)C [Leucobacter sp. Ag1]KKI18437.1 hypothetical protein XM48_11170 [Leucobacter sp. Ag1]
MSLSTVSPIRRAATGVAVSAAALALGLGLTSCSSTPASSEKPSATAEQQQKAPVELADAWVKATDGDMSAVFGTLKNSGSSDVTLESASTPIAGMVELHETIVENGTATMRKKEGGIKIPAGKTAALEPGSTHIMLMDLKKPVKAGDEVPVTLKFSDGSTLEVPVLGKAFSGANENYDGGAEHAGH